MLVSSDPVMVAGGNSTTGAGAGVAGVVGKGGGATGETGATGVPGVVDFGSVLQPAMSSELKARSRAVLGGTIFS